MSHSLISRSEDLSRLKSEGYVLYIRDGTLIVEDVPYEHSGTVKRGAIVCAIEDDTTRTLRPSDHTVWWSGGEPNAALMGLSRSPVCSTQRQTIAGVEVSLQLSIKKRQHDGAWEGYDDYYDKISAYAGFLTRSAKAIDPHADARTGRVVRLDEAESVFLYRDGTAGVRGLDRVNEKVSKEVVAIIGGGGTGSYILDFVSRTPVAEVRIFDDDLLKAHNGYRYPGAVSAEDILKRHRKVDFLSERYSGFRRCIFPYPEAVTGELPSAVLTATFVFLAIDKPSEKRGIVSSLLSRRIPFVHVGMSVNPWGADGNELQATAATTLMAPEDDWNMESAGKYIGFVDSEELGIYMSNAQVVELNALNAAFAVIQWKKYRGIYASIGEVDTTYDTERQLLAKRKAVDK